MVCLRESGVDFNDIKLITNGNMTDFNYFLKNLCNVNMLATPSEILINLLHDSKYQTNFLFVFGHGDINGIKCENNGSHLKAQELLNMFNDKSSNIVFFGQCFSGIFDKVNVKDKNAVFIGATNFCPSLSYLVKYSLRLKNGNQIQLN